MQRCSGDSSKLLSLIWTFVYVTVLEAAHASLLNELRQTRKQTRITWAGAVPQLGTDHCFLVHLLMTLTLDMQVWFWQFNFCASLAGAKKNILKGPLSVENRFP